MNHDVGDTQDGDSNLPPKFFCHRNRCSQKMDPISDEFISPIFSHGQELAQIFDIF